MYDAIVVGAGIAGVCSAVKLEAEGFNFVVLDRHPAIGGTWYANRYPGVGVDTASPSYCYSFAQKTRWSRTYPGGNEIAAYLDSIVDEYGIRDRFRFNCDVSSAEWDDAKGIWTVTLAEGEKLTARHLVGAWGIYSAINDKPDIDGLSDFEGQMFHTARWPEDLDLQGRRVGIVGTGASAVQIIPAIAEEVEKLAVFQRTPVWVTPRPDFALPARLHAALSRSAVLRRALRYSLGAFNEIIFSGVLFVPGRTRELVRIWSWMGRWWLRHEIKDPELRKKLTPDYPFGCKRPTLSNRYLKTYNRANVELVTDRIERITRDGVKTIAGNEYPLDVLILSTGFSLWQSGATPPIKVIGASGESLGDRWEKYGYRSYRGVTVPDYPNLWMTGWGPQGLAGSSYTGMVENQVAHMMRCLKRARECGADRIEVRHRPFIDYSEKNSYRVRQTAYLAPGCAGSNSFYIDRHGNAPIFRTSSTPQMWVEARTFSLDDYNYELTAARTMLEDKAAAYV